MDDGAKHTCLKLEVPSSSGRSRYSIFVRGTWLPSRFRLSITDGLHAWTCEASDAEVKQRAEQWDQPVSEYIALAERYLGFQQPDSEYGFEDAGKGHMRLSWTFEKQGTKLEWRWKCQPSPDSKQNIVEILDFLMDANIRLSEEVVRKTQSSEKLKVEAEKCLLQSQTFCNEKSEFESAAYAKVKNEPVVFPIVHSEDEAYAMYCDYAHRTGFSVRKQHLTYWTHTRIIKGREYSCSKAGMKSTKSSPKKYRKLDTRTKCLACIFFNTDKDGKNWTVTKFVEEHNHPLLTEKEQHLLRSHRNISNMQGKRVDAKKKAIIVDDGEPKAKEFHFLSGSTNEPPPCNISTLIRCLADSIEPLERFSQGHSES